MTQAVSEEAWTDDATVIEVDDDFDRPWLAYDNLRHDIEQKLADIGWLVKYERIGEATLASGQLQVMFKNLNQLIVDERLDKQKGGPV
jgi:hypothetical protein